MNIIEKIEDIEKSIESMRDRYGGVKKEHIVAYFALEREIERLQNIEVSVVDKKEQGSND